MIYPYKGKTPSFGAGVFIAASADIIGDVTIGARSSVWFGSVVRGDVDAVRIGERTNVQDGCVLHVRHDGAPLTIGSRVTLGHRVIAHACTIGDTVLVGMGAIVLDRAVVEPYAMIAAGAVVRPGMVVPGGVLVAGVPAKIVRELTAAERAMVERSAEEYCAYAQSFITREG